MLLNITKQLGISENSIFRYIFHCNYWIHIEYITLIFFGQYLSSQSWLNLYASLISTNIVDLSYKLFLNSCFSEKKNTEFLKKKTFDFNKVKLRLGILFFLI